MNKSLALPFYSGEGVQLGDQSPAPVPVQKVVICKTLVDYLPLLIALISLALTLYMLSQQKRRVQ